MTLLYSFLRPSTVTVLGVLTLASVASLSRPAVAAQFYQQINLVTDNQAQLAASGFAPAAHVDPNLVKWSSQLSLGFSSCSC